MSDREIYKPLIGLTFVALLCVAASAQSLQPMMKGSGSERMMLFKGNVVTEGQAAQEYELRANLKRQFGRQNLSPKVQDDQFEFWARGFAVTSSPSASGCPITSPACEPHDFLLRAVVISQRLPQLASSTIIEYSVRILSFRFAEPDSTSVNL